MLQSKMLQCCNPRCCNIASSACNYDINWEAWLVTRLAVLPFWRGGVVRLLQGLVAVNRDEREQRCDHGSRNGHERHHVYAARYEYARNGGRHITVCQYVASPILYVLLALSPCRCSFTSTAVSDCCSTHGRSLMLEVGGNCIHWFVVCLCWPTNHFKKNQWCFDDCIKITFSETEVDSPIK